VTSPFNEPLKLIAVVAVVAVVALPLKLAVIVPALKLPDASRLTIVLAVLLLVAAFARTVAEATFAAVCPPTVETTVAPCVPVTSPVNDPVKLVLVVAVVAVVAVAALPFNAAVIIPAAKLPDASRDTIAFAVLLLVAVVAELATFPAVLIVASLVSRIPADELISESIINELDRFPEVSL